MTDEHLATWLESTGFPQAAEAASRLRELNIQISSLRKTTEVVTPPKRWPHLGDISDPPTVLTDKAPVRRRKP